jgi:hypothetical protein
MNMVEREDGDSPRPYGTRKRHWDAIPGFRFASSGAIFVSSLREEGGRVSVSETEGTIFGNKNHSCSFQAGS